MNTNTYAITGTMAHPVRVEVDALDRLPNIQVVGMFDAAGKEAKERVQSAIRSSGFHVPRKRIIVNLAPADLRKDGQGFDLPMAMGILGLNEVVTERETEGFAFVGELALDGRIRPVRGVLAIAGQAWKDSLILICPSENFMAAREAFPGLLVYPCATLLEAIKILKDKNRPETIQPAPKPDQGFRYDYKDIQRLDMNVMRAIMVAILTGIPLILKGPAGCGKTMYAARIGTILDDMDRQESLETSTIHDAAGLTGPDVGLMRRRPFRCPHHSISEAGMIGSSTLRPGEVSLAHNGVLFLDELPEFMHNVRDAAFRAHREQKVSYQRALDSVEFPAKFTMIMASNNCPCGHKGSPIRPCTCSTEAIIRYEARIPKGCLQAQMTPFDTAKIGQGTVSSQDLHESLKDARHYYDKAMALNPGIDSHDRVTFAMLYVGMDPADINSLYPR